VLGEGEVEAEAEAPVGAEVMVADDRVEPEEPEEPEADGTLDPVVRAVRAPSQCQWSPWGSQPYDSVGDGARDPVPAASVCSSVWSWSWSSSSWLADELTEVVMAEVMTAGALVAAPPSTVEVSRGPSQCLGHWSVSRDDATCDAGTHQ
jgi:hypothetical protein